MSSTVMMAVLLAALLHACWNFLVKKNPDKAVSVTGIIIGHIPLAMAGVILAPLPNPQALPYLLLGTLLHLGYQFFLINAYRVGDLSQVYPLARGVAPLIVTVFSVLVLGAVLAVPQIVAVTAIGVGIMSLAQVRRKDGARNTKAALAALTTGGFIASYSLVDGTGARVAETALGFYAWLTVINASALLLWMRVFRAGMFTAVVFKNWKLTFGGGSAAFTAYAIVTWGFTQAPIALVTALRETSIIFALLLGSLVLKERLDSLKIFATAVTVIGIILLRMYT
jgi:drug/metabolite transporter (DMT)-like permease